MLKKLNLKRHALTGISYMIPVVVVGGLCMGLTKVFGGWDIAAGTFAAALDAIGSAAINFTVPVIAACTAGSVVSGALAVFFGCQMPIPHGGVFAVPFCEKPFMFLLAFVIGCLVTAVILIALKPKKAEDSQDIEAELTEEIEFTI